MQRARKIDATIKVEKIAVKAVKDGREIITQQKMAKSIQELLQKKKGNIT